LANSSDGPTFATGGRSYEVTHRTVYRYSDDVTSSYGRGFLTPRDSPRQRCLSHELKIEPEAADSSTSRDQYGNISSYFHVTERHRTLIITSHSVVEVDPPPGRERMVGVDATHAWASVWTPQNQWLGLDPTNDQMVDERYVVVGFGRDYADVPPLRGIIYTDSESSVIDVAVDVAPFEGGVLRA
jgi:transglutaminase-like putative cysteine protease